MTKTSTMSEMQAPPHNTPLQIRVKEGGSDRMATVPVPFVLPKDLGLLNQMGEFQWAEWPEYKEGSL